MKELLYLTKAFAIAAGDQELDLSHFAKALTCVEITDKNVAALLERRVPGVDPAYDDQNSSARDVDALLALAIQTDDKLPINDTLMSVIRRLESHNNFYLLRAKPGVDDGLPPGLKRAKRVRATLQRAVFGQEEAIAALSGAVARQSVRGKQEKGLAGLYLLAGPSASGKTLSASLLADGLGEGYRTFHMDMSALTNQNDECSLIGTQANFQRSAPGVLTKFVYEIPKSVAILDNFDRAHPNIQNVLIKLLDTGYLTDQHGLAEDERTTDVDFRSVHLILITDRGETLYDQPSLVKQMRADGGEARVRSLLVHALATAKNMNYENNSPAFSSALLSRMERGEVVLFNRLNHASLKTIAAIGLEQARKTFKAVSGLKQCDISPCGDDLLDLLIFGQGNPDARRLSEGSIYSQFFGPLEQQFVSGEKRPTKLSLTMPDTSRQALAAIRSELGDDPLFRLYRLNKRVDFQVESKTTRSHLTLSFVRPRLERKSAANDYGGQGGITIDVPDVRFADVAGHEKIKAKLREQVSLLRDTSALRARGLEPPRGMLLWGPPGTGKTLLASALAGEADMPFLAMVATELFDLDLLRNVFAKLRRYAPAMLFIDEIDALGRRGSGADPVINTLLAEIDGFVRSEQPIFVVAATNFPSKVDPALLRAGRLELQFEVEDLDRAGRLQMLKRLAPIASNSVSLDKLISYTAGCSGAQMASAIREAHMRVIRGGPDLLDNVLDEVALRDVFDSIRLGEASGEERFSPGVREHAAYHEAGHALALSLLTPDHRIENLSISVRGNSIGRVDINTESVLNSPMNRLALKNQLTILMAGRVSEVIHFGQEEGLDNGAADDLAKATKLSYRAITEFGLDLEVGAINLAGWREAEMVLPNLHALIETRLRVWLKEAEDAAFQLLTRHRDTLERIAEALIAEDAIDTDRFAELMVSPKPTQAEPACVA